MLLSCVVESLLNENQFSIRSIMILPHSSRALPLPVFRTQFQFKNQINFCLTCQTWLLKVIFTQRHLCSTAIFKFKLTCSCSLFTLDFYVSLVSDCNFNVCNVQCGFQNHAHLDASMCREQTWSPACIKEF